LGDKLDGDVDEQLPDNIGCRFQRREIPLKSASLWIASFRRYCPIHMFQVYFYFSGKILSEVFLLLLQL